MVDYLKQYEMEQQEKEACEDCIYELVINQCLNCTRFFVNGNECADLKDHYERSVV